MSQPPPSELHAIAAVELRLVREHPELATEAIHGVVVQAHDRFAGARVRQYVPVLVERAARESLRRAAG